MLNIINRPDLQVFHGNADEWDTDLPIDFILTNPYGFMPRKLADTPALIHQWGHRHQDAEKWSHMRLDFPIASWNRGREIFWANYAVRNPVFVDLSEFVPETGGWYPEELARRLLVAYVKPGQTLWDGFMGRGTVGKVCLELGINYIGIEQLSAHVTLALDYLGVTQ